MLHIFLQILAILGIILLCILGLLLFLLVLILFVPIRYKAIGEKNETIQEIHVNVSYLLHILSIHYDLSGKQSVLTTKIFGIRLKSGKRKKGKEKGKKEEAAKQKSEKEDTDPEVKEEFMEKMEDTKPLSEDSSSISSKNNQPLSKSLKEETKEEGAKEEGPKKKRYTIGNFCDKIKDIRENFEYYRDLLTDEENKKLYGRLWEKAIKILISIRPRKMKAHLHIGTGSPDTTGYLLALYGILFTKFGNNVVLDADFENKVLEGDFFLKGRIIIFSLLKYALPILFDKQFKDFKKKLKREE